MTTVRKDPDDRVVGDIQTKGTVLQTQVLSVSVKTAKRQRLNKSKRQRIGISQTDESYSNSLNQSQDMVLEPDASYSALETVASYSGLQNRTQDIVILMQATVL
ncbi:cysteine-rich receptor-like protein kinase 9 [Dorcoceras hygrometricum]|uniref:Cysteine-rich receptor-like protein kinase 9 n=1 Tax=Dorcoceras hygrometricum TaxID=472368 RepID=A0A2Z7BBG2_9LAMI|nr:cysteine-rich receptor-like protein kinase 9 [Dorcoceras hygrometricum]